jgi:hypothetical protein
MKKDSQLTVRIPENLKVQLEQIAASEGRSTAQVCEAFLRAGAESYRKKGARFVRDFLNQQRKPE